MKIWLDDIRPAPEGWLWIKMAEDLSIAVFRYWSEIEMISLDHDLGEGVASGYDFLVWLEEYVFTQNITCPFEIRVHSANPVGRNKMLAAIASIQGKN